MGPQLCESAEPCRHRCWLRHSGWQGLLARQELLEHKLGRERILQDQEGNRSLWCRSSGTRYPHLLTCLLPVYYLCSVYYLSTTCELPVYYYLCSVYYLCFACAT